MGYCVLRIEKVKSLKQMENIYRHNYRIADVDNANPELAHLNEELISLKGKTLNETFAEKMEKSINNKNNNARKIRKNGVLGFDVVLTFSREESEKINLKNWYQDNVNWLKKNFNLKDQDNVVSAIAHRDEMGCVHIHAFVIPMNEKDKLSAFSFIKNPSDMRSLQSSYAEAMKPHGLERGKEYSVAKHIEIKKFYTALNKVSAKNLPKPLNGEDIESYYERANNAYVQKNLKEFDEYLKDKQRIVESDTDLLQKQLEIKALEKEFKKKMKRLQTFCDSISEEGIESGKSLEEVKQTLNEHSALKTGIENYPNREFASSIKQGIKIITNWTEGEREKRDKEWEDLFR